VGSLGNRTKMGVLHASYGLGAFCAPLLATYFAQRAHWSFHFLFSLGFSLVNVAALAAVFRLRTLNGAVPWLPVCFGWDADRAAEVLAVAGYEAADAGAGAKYGQIMRIRAVHLLAIWALVYVGVECTLGGACQPSLGLLRPARGLKTRGRMDGDVHRAGTRRWPVGGVYVVWVLWGSVLFPSDTAVR
jgi:fucose permease